MAQLPSPPAEDTKAVLPRKLATSKATKSVNRVTKRPSSTTSSHPHHDSHGTSVDGRHKRVWKACERCRMKKTKCDGEFPCKRCKDDGLVCTAGVRKKVEFKQLPRGYAEVLENTQFALIQTVHRLYNMVITGQTWDLGKPEENDRGQPVIHDIAQRLGCIRPNNDIDLPIPAAFPENKDDLDNLAQELKQQEQEQEQSAVHESGSINDTKDSHSDERHEHGSSSDSEDDETSPTYDVESFQGYRSLAFGNSNPLALSPESFTTSNDFDSTGLPEVDMNQFPMQSPVAGEWSNNWHMAQMKLQMQENMVYGAHSQQANTMPVMDLYSSGFLESNFGIPKPHIVANQGHMIGPSDPMIYGIPANYDAENNMLE